MKALIIEDEELAIKKLVGLIHKFDENIEIIGGIDTVEDAVDWFSNNNLPDILFLDIHLADGSSFEIFEYVTVDCPIIFTTAYDNYALDAFKTNSIDYLLKPIKYDHLETALKKYYKIYPLEKPKPNQLNMDSLAELIRKNDKAYKSRFLVKSGNLISTVPINDVAYFYFEDRVTFLMTFEKKRFSIKQTLDELEGLLNPKNFNRANRQFIINIEAIDKIHPWFKGRLKLTLRPLQVMDLVISADKTRAFKAWLDR